LICKPFQYGESPYTLNDALCLTQAQWDALTPAEIEAMQQARYDGWREAMTRPPTVDEEPVEEVI
jgi:hypothetical protein